MQVFLRSTQHFNSVGIFHPPSCNRVKLKCNKLRFPGKFVRDSKNLKLKSSNICSLNFEKNCYTSADWEDIGETGASSDMG